MKIAVPVMEPAITTEEVARRLAISSKTVVRYATLGKNPLPHFKVGNKYRFLWSEVENYFGVKPNNPEEDDYE